MDIRQFMDMDRLQQIQDQFSKATGLAAIAVDAKGEYLTKPSNFTDFCMRYTRANEEGARRCQKCDTECTGTYFCHAGLIDFSKDIMLEGEKVGAMLGGQILSEEPDLEKFRGIARELGIPEEDYVNAVKRVPVRTEEQIRAAADLMGDMINLWVNLEYFKKVNAERIQIFDRELQHSMALIGEIQKMNGELHKISTMETILALNASVEAAHSGAAGVGFAVVAKELSRHSQDSANVYSEVFRLIDGVKESILRMNGKQTDTDSAL